MRKTFWVSSFDTGLTFVIVSALHHHLSVVQRMVNYCQTVEVIDLQLNDSSISCVEERHTTYGPQMFRILAIHSRSGNSGSTRPAIILCGWWLEAEGDKLTVQSLQKADTWSSSQASSCIMEPEILFVHKGWLLIHVQTQFHAMYPFTF